ncbi:PREDICTED: ATP-binding cassette sub-family G member 4-like [Atta cephalotes]|uniref:ABC transporter domain-containing protein n=1 Tax=Atta cephalotes TaxID=12957 RepID=A0A158P456_ATTCE|nr:PREDICTED: ATP-binding cassette sub-family G member 4-like [Atta cephalotes]
MLEMNDKNNAAKILKSDCEIHMQESEILLEPVKSWNSQMYIEFNDLCYSVPCNLKGTKKIILHNVTGHFESGKVTVIVGPSGSGKTTLLKIILSKQQVNIKGTITVNSAKQNRKMFRKQVCYIPQQFDLLPYLTTRETLYTAARLKLDVNQSKQAICSMVNDIAKRLNLSKCLDTLANKLSGGERKRLSIGVEMFVQPSVFLLDEPTSGLDSTDSNQTFLRTFSEHWDVFRTFCKTSLDLCYTWVVKFVLEVVTEQKGGDMENLYKICCDEYVKFRLRNKHNKKELDLSINSKQKCGTKDTDASINSIIQKKSTWQQQKILFLRSLIYIKRDRILTKLRIVTHIIIALLLGTVFYNFGDDAEKVGSNIAYLFFCLLFLYFTNAILAVQIFPIEATVFLREHLNNWYSLRSYYSVKIISDLLIQILCASSFTLISYYITGQPMEYDRILRVWGISLLITIIGQTIGILSGTIFGTELGMFFIPAIGIPLLLFAGFFSKLGEMSIYLQPLTYVNFFRYAFEGIMQAIYLDRPNLTCLEIYCYLRSPNKILMMMGIPTVPYYVTLIILASWIFFFHAITYAVLLWKIYYAKK